MDYLTNVCVKTLTGKSLSQVRKHGKCVVNNQAARKSKRFYFKQPGSTQLTYLGSEREFDNCIHRVHGKDVDVDKVKHGICRDNANVEKAELIRYVDALKTNKLINEDTYLFLKYLVQKTNIDTAAFKEVMGGGFIIIQDHGAFYRKFRTGNEVLEYDEGKQYFGRQTHASSHWSKDRQVRMGKGGLMDLEGKNRDAFDLLIGTSVLPQFEGCTWFQLEANPTTTLKLNVLHGLNWIDYKLKGKNVGPFGYSRYTELKDLGPLLLKTCKGLDNCLFEGEASPAQASADFWAASPLSIKDYADLTGMVQSISGITPLQGIRRIARVEMQPVLNAVVERLQRGGLQNLQKYIPNLTGCRPVNAVETIPDNVVMNVLKSIYRCAIKAEAAASVARPRWSHKLKRGTVGRSAAASKGASRRSTSKAPSMQSVEEVPKATAATMAPSRKATMAPSRKVTMAPSRKATIAPSRKVTMAPSRKATMAPSRKASMDESRLPF
jgi:hypothetical protein